MKKHLIFLIILCITFNLSTAQDVDNYCADGKIKAFSQMNKVSQVQYPGDSNIDVTYYKLNLAVKTNPNRLDGVVTVKAKAASNNLTNFFLDLVNAMSVSSIKLGGSNLLFSQSNNQLFITLNRTYSTGEEFSIDITYGGIPTSGSGFISNASFIFYDQAAAKPVVATLSEPYGARDWWPSKDTPADKADSSDVWITADKFFVSVSNGKLMETTDNPDGTRTYKWKNHYPIANYLISIAMTNYETIEDQFEYEPGKFLPLIHYCYPERLDYIRREAVAKTKDMLQIFSDKFGPYPYLKEKYGHAEFSWGGGMEHQTITSMGGGAMNSENTIAHELAHQWFGDKVTCKDWQNIWLNEGFASYAECIYREAKYGNADFRSYVDIFMYNPNNPNRSAKNAVGTIYVQDISSENEIFNSARSYKKGAIVLHMLRGIVGDNNFFQILREFLTEPGLSYNVATTDDFKRIAERVSGMNLKYFFDEWIYGDSYPKYTVGKNAKLVSGNNYNVTVRLIQNTNLSLNPRYFTMPVKIRITTPNGIVNTTVFNEYQEQAWSIPVVGLPSNIEIDPDNWIMKDIVGTTSADGNLEIPTTFSLSQNYPNPFNPTTVISYQLPVNSHVSLKIYDELGKKVATLVDEFKEAGTYWFHFTNNNLKITSGVYYYTLSAGEFLETKKMVLLK